MLPYSRAASNLSISQVSTHSEQTGAGSIMTALSFCSSRQREQVNGPAGARETVAGVVLFMLIDCLVVGLDWLL